jgi:amino acid transporter
MSPGDRAARPASPTLLRAVSRWQIVGLAINDVIGSGIYLLPAAAAALLGAASLWAVLLAGLAVTLLVLCYAQAASYFDEPGGGYLYAREAFGRFVGFEVGWMTWLTRIASAAALANGLALAAAEVWPAAGQPGGRAIVIVAGLGLVTWINVVGVLAGARMGVLFTIAKMVPLVCFVVVGAFFMDWTRLAVHAWPPGDRFGEAALLLLFAYAGFENSAAGAGEYRNPRRDLPFALVAMIAIVTATYVAIQAVAIGTLPDLAHAASPLAEAASRFAGPGAALLLTIGAVVSILGNIGNTTLFGPRYAYALAVDGFGPRALARVDPRYRTPRVAIVAQSVVALMLALTGSFVQLALLSVVARLTTYVATTTSLLVLRRRFAGRPDTVVLPGGPLVPLAALGVSLVLMAAATWTHLVAGGVALAAGAIVYLFRRPPRAPAITPAA